ncbi:MAG: winged helix-turn-helix domain-containing protein [Acidobacteriaceae bacterium]|nr:winged helix-turn-helix domain-containing protein [Acidobacteriaceae bacterium]MBV9035907.1 winged helix-turn-helix domain-containing protein [Acidobacteriaceae bacterium]
MPQYTFGPFLLDGEARILFKDGKPVPVTGRLFDTLLLLVQNKGRLVNKDELLSCVWRGASIEEANLTQAIFSLRKILGDRPKDHRYIATVPGCGYQFAAPVTELAAIGQPVTSRSDPIRMSVKTVRRRLAWLWLSVAAFCIAAVLLLVSWQDEPMRTPMLTTVAQLTNDGKPKNELVTDGVRIFYASPAQQNLSHWRTYQVAITGGEIHSLPSIHQDMSPFDISPDRTELLLGLSEVRQADDGWTKPNQLWLQPLAGGPPRILMLQAQDACWSADGSQIAYASGKELGLAWRDGAPDHKLADLPGVASGLRWSPDGHKIRFTLHYGIALKDSAIWEIASQGGKAHPLFPHWSGQQGDGQWTPDGRYYFFSRIDKGVSQIWVLPERKFSQNASTPSPVQLTTGPMQCFLPTPSPDGKRLLFYGMLERTLLLKYDASSHRFEPFLSGISGAHLDFSRDGKWVTYSSYPEHALWRAAADGTQRLKLSPSDMIALLPVISPDGTRIAFGGGSPGQPFSIFVVGFNGGALQTIVSTQSGLVEPAWSPDGASLVLGPYTDQSALYRFDFANRRLSELPGSEGLWSPRWSPDGQLIAALGSPDSILMLYDLKSHLKTAITDYRTVFNPVWAHDGQYIYFGSGIENGAWYRVRTRDRKVERLVSLTDVGALPAKPSRGVPTWINRWTGLAPDDSLLATREVGSTEIYSADWIER